MRRWTRGAVLLAAGVLVAATAAPAATETVERTDARRDAPASIDIATATYTHTRAHVRVVARIPELGGAGSASLSISRFGIFEAGYVVQIKKRAGRPARTRLLFFNHFDLEPRRCADLTGAWGRGRVVLSVARSCLSGHAEERVFAQFGIQRGAEIDRARAVKRLDRA